jgi:hypothetical protein
LYVEEMALSLTTGMTCDCVSDAIGWQLEVLCRQNCYCTAAGNAELRAVLMN